MASSSLRICASEAWHLWACGFNSENPLCGCLFPPAPTLQLIPYPDTWQTPFRGVVLSARVLAFNFFFFAARKKEQKCSQCLDVQLQVLAQLLGACLLGSSEAASETENLAFPGCSTSINIDGHPEFTVSALRPSSWKTTSIHPLQVMKVVFF